MSLLRLKDQGWLTHRNENSTQLELMQQTKAEAPVEGSSSDSNRCLETFRLQVGTGDFETPSLFGGQKRLLSWNRATVKKESKIESGRATRTVQWIPGGETNLWAKISNPAAPLGSSQPKPLLPQIRFWIWSRPRLQWNNKDLRVCDRANRVAWDCLALCFCQRPFFFDDLCLAFDLCLVWCAGV
jgi:hypothetical protein